MRKCAALEGLGLGECVHIGDAATLEIVTYKPNIRHLDLNGCKKITDNSLRSISTFCTMLEHLNLRSTSVTDNGLNQLSTLKVSNALKELNLSYLPVSDSILERILKHFKE